MIPFGIGSGCPGVGSGTFGGSGSLGRFEGIAMPTAASGLPASAPVAGICGTAGTSSRASAVPA